MIDYDNNPDTPYKCDITDYIITPTIDKCELYAKFQIVDPNNDQLTDFSQCSQHSEIKNSTFIALLLATVIFWFTFQTDLSNSHNPRVLSVEQELPVHLYPRGFHLDSYFKNNSNPCDLQDEKLKLIIGLFGSATLIIIGTLNGSEALTFPMALCYIQRYSAVSKD